MTVFTSGCYVVEEKTVMNKGNIKDQHSEKYRQSNYHCLRLERLIYLAASFPKNNGFDFTSSFELDDFLQQDAKDLQECLGFGDSLLKDLTKPRIFSGLGLSKREMIYNFLWMTKTLGFVGQFSCPMKAVKEGYCYDWDRITTSKWLYGNTIDELFDKALDWREQN